MVEKTFHNTNLKNCEQFYPPFLHIQTAPRSSDVLPQQLLLQFSRKKMVLSIHDFSISLPHDNCNYPFSQNITSNFNLGHIQHKVDEVILTDNGKKMTFPSNPEKPTNRKRF